MNRPQLEHRQQQQKLPPNKINLSQFYSSYIEELNENHSTIFSTVFSPDNGRYLLACSSLGIVYCWDVLGSDNDDCGDTSSKGSSIIDTGSREKENNCDNMKSCGNGNSSSKNNCFSKTYWDNMHSTKDEDDSIRPILRIQVIHGNAYDLQFLHASNENNDTLLAISGDGGVYVYKWSKLLALLQKHSSSSNDLKEDSFYTTTAPIPLIEDLIPHTILKPFPNAFDTQKIEMNSTSYDKEHNYLYAAAGDVFGCYQFDLSTGQIMRTLNSTLNDNHNGSSSSSSSSSNQRDYLHVVKVIESGKVLTAGESGAMTLWDGKEGKEIDVIQIKQSILQNNQKKISLTMDHPQPSVVSTYSNHHFWISDLDVEHDPLHTSTTSTNNWIALGGGIETYHQKPINYSSSSKNNNNTGFVALWNLPTRSITSIHLTNENVQCIKYLQPSNNIHNTNRIVTLGNEPYVSYWNCYKSIRMERASVSSRRCFDSGFACCIHPKNGSMVVGGVKSSCGLGAGASGFGLSCFAQIGHPSFEFSL